MNWTLILFALFVVAAIIIVVVNRGESFAPYVSTQAYDMPRDDPAFDHVPVRTHKGDPARLILPAYPAGPLGHSTENYLFHQTMEWGALPSEDTFLL